MRSFFCNVHGMYGTQREVVRYDEITVGQTCAHMLHILCSINEPIAKGCTAMLAGNVSMALHAFHHAFVCIHICIQLHTHIELQFIYISFWQRKIIIIALDLYMSCLTAVFWYLPWGNKPCIVVPHKLLVGPIYMRRSLPLEPVERLGWFGFERCNEDDMETVISYKSWGRILLGLEQKMVSDKTLGLINKCYRVMTYCNIFHKSMYLLCVFSQDLSQLWWKLMSEFSTFSFWMTPGAVGWILICKHEM